MLHRRRGHSRLSKKQCNNDETEHNCRLEAGLTNTMHGWKSRQNRVILFPFIENFATIRYDLVCSGFSLLIILLC